MLHAAAIFVSAFLLFLVQPIIAKQILPWFGGSAGVWTLCMLFFQLVLLAGYAYANLVQRLAPKQQALLHAALAILACGVLPITADPSWRPTEPGDPTGRILLVLVATIGLPYFLLSTTGPLVQSWYARLTGHRSAVDAARVYRLFALSNLASLLALVAYPFAVEPFATLRTQAWVWSAGFVVFVMLVIAAGWQTVKRGAASLEAIARPTPSRIEPLRALGWLGLAALGTVMLLSVTTHITQDVASVPFLWILPLAIYLLSFILCFDSARWYRRALFWPAVIVLSPAMIWALFYKAGVMPIEQAIPLFSIGLFAICMFCHGELARDKPAAASLTFFYLMISLGGAVGGILVGLVAPRLFDGYWEFPIALVVAAAAVMVLAHPRRQGGLVIFSVSGVGVIGALILYYIRPQVSPFETGGFMLGLALLVSGALAMRLRSWPIGASIAGGMAMLACLHLSAVYVKSMRDDTLMTERNFYGMLRVRQTGIDSKRSLVRRLTHGVIMHGEQYLDAEMRRFPTSYYGLTSGAGLAIRHIHRPDPHIGVIGLGAGTLASYGLPGGTVRYYEINPLVLDTARRFFSYLSDSDAKVDVEIGDARLVLERELAEHHPQGFDVLVVDAFSSDAIPVHLLTREALDIYRQHLRDGGVIAFHVTNRYLNLAPVIRGLAEQAGMKAILVADDPDAREFFWESRTDYVLVYQDSDIASDPEIVKRTELIVPVPGLPLWTDDYSNLWRIRK